MSKNEYRQLCLSDSSIPIYSQDWWLDIVCGERYWDVLLWKKKEHILAAFPYYKPCKGVISMPFYTQTMGPWIASLPKDMTYRRRLSLTQEILKDFILQIKDYPCFLQNFHHSLQDWLPFYWAGYTQTTRYTYILRNIKHTQSLWEQMSANIRRNILRAEQKHQIQVRKQVSTQDFIRIQAQTFHRQNLAEPKGIQVLIRLIDACRQRGQGDIWGGYDQAGNLHAAAFIVWHADIAYYLAGGGNPELRDSGAHSLVLWKAIQELSTQVNQFDFEGSMIPGVERFFREFGAKQFPFFTIKKGKLSLWNRLMIKINSI